jgi:hypothetical protein
MGHSHAIRRPKDDTQNRETRAARLSEVARESGASNSYLAPSRFVVIAQGLASGRCITAGSEVSLWSRRAFLNTRSRVNNLELFAGRSVVILVGDDVHDRAAASLLRFIH